MDKGLIPSSDFCRFASGSSAVDGSGIGRFRIGGLISYLDEECPVSDDLAGRDREKPCADGVEHDRLPLHYFQVIADQRLLVAVEVVAVDCRLGLIGDVLLRSGALVADIAFPLRGRIDRLRRPRVRRGGQAVDLRECNIWRRHFLGAGNNEGGASRSGESRWSIVVVVESIAVCSRWRVREKRWALCSWCKLQKPRQHSSAQSRQKIIESTACIEGERAAGHNALIPLATRLFGSSFSTVQLLLRREKKGAVAVLSDAGCEKARQG